MTKFTMKQIDDMVTCALDTALAHIHDEIGLSKKEDGFKTPSPFSAIEEDALRSYALLMIAKYRPEQYPKGAPL